ncbi:MAG TPA: EthD family reductase [Chloroflexota bacterium]|jgi:uncharacterized protein (TIGR02118 family)|nr:EthD family reductase [Chloroflexota bacterium]
MVKLVGLIRKRNDLTTEQFRSHWLKVHAPLARQFPGLRRYAVNFIDREASPDAAYDGFSELWFDSAADLDAAFAGPIGAAIADDIPKFMEELVRVIVEEHSVVE